MATSPVNAKGRGCVGVRNGFSAASYAEGRGKSSEGWCKEPGWEVLARLRTRLGWRAQHLLVNINPMKGVSVWTRGLVQTPGGCGLFSFTTYVLSW